MRQLTSHQINECNQAIEIVADERDPQNGNASHAYLLEYVPPRAESAVDDVNPQRGGFSTIEIRFQHGPIKEVGTNGITHEALLAILIDRMEGFQAGAYACTENQQALDALMVARSALNTRTKKRVARGVEGTHEV